MHRDHVVCIGVVSDIHGNLAALEAVADALASAAMTHLAEHHDAPDWAHALRTGPAPDRLRTMRRHPSLRKTMRTGDIPA